MKQGALVDNYVILEMLEKDLLAFRVISLKSRAMEPPVMDYNCGQGLKVRISRLAEPASLDFFIENGGTNDRVHSFRSHIAGVDSSRDFLTAVHYNLATASDLEPERFRQAIYSEDGLLKLLNLELVFTPTPPSLGEHLYETEKRITSYFRGK